MITSKFILQQAEEYFTSKAVLGHDVVLIKNPTYDDLKSLKAQEIRFIANNKSQNVFVWDANLALHRDVWQITTGTGADSTARAVGHPEILAGRSELSSNKLTIIGWDVFTDFIRNYSRNKEAKKDFVSFFKSFFNLNWTWLNRYFTNGDKYIQDCKMKFLKEIK